ncbi:hypothetical protein OEZ85_012624 [Tetradesmus obliquus]|uniref:Mediator complex subunit 20 n=1 Tax=Tetradesmus obliquus TaxID=3088 RepID=A0ABY8U608_TETOB|nr:hypothetical protein OEZ85_012624 [Tetradesmus obliquus]
MAIKCILLYKLPKGVLPTKSDAERIITVLTEQLCCVQEGGRGTGGGSGEKQLEALINIYKQTQAPDLTAVASPVSLTDVWAFRLAREAPSKTFLMIRLAGPRGGLRVTEAEPSIRSFLERRLDYRQRAQLAIQSYSWSMGDKHSDVTVKLLQVSQQAQTPKVLAVEVTYHPAVDLAAGGAVLAELAGRIAELVGPEVPGQPGSLVLLQPDYSRFNAEELPGAYGPMHIVVAYNELLAEGLGAR